MIGEPQAREVEVKAPPTLFKVGDEVMVRIRPATGYAAVAWLYVAPFLAMISVLLFLQASGFQESVAGLGALMALIPYYASLFLLRRYFRRHCKVDVVRR